jgi:hypothetical protein
MNGTVLLGYFEGRVSAVELKADLDGTRTRLGSDSVRHNMVDVDRNFSVTTNHLIKLCDAVLAGDIPPEQLEWIGFGLIASDHFHWDTDTLDGERVADALIDWASPTTNYVLTMETVAKFRRRLATGENTFDKMDFGSAGISSGRVTWNATRDR